MQEVLKRIYDYNLEDIMGERFGRYSKTIIQDRALPDVRDGLKPVQRRILYAMYRDRNTYDKPYKKSAKTVGNVMGQYHPHGDSSIYEAMVRMSQWWKQNECYIDMHGNNGSMDGDSPAAMRYTEARLSKISNELLKDIDKNTIIWAWNYDDTLEEPTVLPAKYPNLLVNGSTGISAGYATNIPPHNLGEVIDATIKRIDSPNCRLDTILEIVKGPDFPTGAICCGKKGIIDAFTNGRGKVIVKSKYEIIKNKGKEQIVITEIPFEVNKASLVRKIDEIRLDKKVDGIVEIRDESDRENSCRIVIDLKSGVDSNLIINYLLKNTELQISYNYNMVAIVNRRPITLGILPILDAYIEHQKEIITKRTRFDLNHAKKQLEIDLGFIKMVSILDEVIKTIRASKNKSDAKVNLIKQYEFTEVQAETIVMLQLYKLTNTDVLAVEEDKEKLIKIIAGLEKILNDEEVLKGVMKEELRKIKKEYAEPRKTEIQDEIEEIKIDTVSMIPKEDCVVAITKDGYVKRTSLRSYSATDSDITLKDGDYIIGIYELNTMDTILMFTDLGNYLYVPVYELPDLKWKEMGKHISNIIKIGVGENIISVVPVTDFETDKYVTIFTKDGMIKRSLISDFKVSRYTKPMTSMKLKSNDLVVDVTDKLGSEVFITTHNGYGLRFDINEVPITGVKAGGVKSISLKNDFVVSGNVFNDEEYISIITSKNTGKRVKLSEFERISRARKGVLVIRDVKTNPYYILKAFILPNKYNLGLKFKEEIENIKYSDLPIVDRYSTGSTLTKKQILDIFEVKKMLNPKEEPKIELKEINKEDISLNSVDERIMTIDDFLNDLDIGE